MPTPAYVAGYLLHASIGGVAVSVRKQNIMCKVVSLPATNSKSGGYQELLKGIKSFSGTLTLIIDSTAVPTLVEGDIVACVVGVTGARTVTGNAMIESIADDADAEGDYTVTVTINSSATYTVA